MLNRSPIFSKRHLRSSTHLSVIAVDLFFEKAHSKNSSGIRSGDHTDQMRCMTMRSLKKSCKTAVVVLAVWVLTQFAETSNLRFQNSKKLSHKIQIVFHSNFLFKQWSHNLFFQILHTKHQSVMNAEDFHARQWTCAEWCSKCGKSQLQQGSGGHLICLFQYW